MRVPESVGILWRNLIVNSIIGAKWFPRPLRAWALRRYGMDVGKCIVFADIFFDGADFKNLHLRDGVLINNGCYIDLTGEFSMAEGAGLGAGVRILTATHHVGSREQRWGEMFSLPVRIGKGVWVASDVTILPGVTIGEGCVIGAGSLVTKDCEPDGVYVGRPAKLLRRLDHAGNVLSDDAAEAGQ